MVHVPKRVESRGLYVLILLADMLNTIFQQLIIVSNGDRAASGRAAIAIFVLIAILFFIGLAASHFVYLCIKEHHYTSHVASFIQAIGALLYYYGNNATYIVSLYSTDIGCDANCVASNRIAASFSLGMALVIFQILPSVIHKVIEMLKGKHKPKPDKQPNWYAAVDMITVMVKVDALYSVILIMVEDQDFCSMTDIGTTVSFVVFCILICSSAVIVYGLYALHTNKEKDPVFKALVIFGMVVIIICFPLYVLADNHQPLDCAFGCDTFASNTTINDMTCNQSANSGVRLSFTFLTFIAITGISITYFVFNHKEQKHEREVGTEETDKHTHEHELHEVSKVV